MLHARLKKKKVPFHTFSFILFVAEHHLEAFEGSWNPRRKSLWLQWLIDGSNCKCRTHPDSSVRKFEVCHVCRVTVCGGSGAALHSCILRQQSQAANYRIKQFSSNGGTNCSVYFGQRLCVPVSANSWKFSKKVKPRVSPSRRNIHKDLLQCLFFLTQKNVSGTLKLNSNLSTSGDDTWVADLAIVHCMVNEAWGRKEDSGWGGLGGVGAGLTRWHCERVNGWLVLR